MKIFRANQRGAADHNWLKSYFSFSFAEYYNPERMGFGSLRVINDDIIAPNSGFPTHFHKNMEIITIVTKGAVTHEDSRKNKETIKAGEVQYMCAGSGIYHSEFNHSTTEGLELFQIWIKPKSLEEKPFYEKMDFSKLLKKEGWITLVSQNQDNTLKINQDAEIKIANIKSGATLSLPSLEKNYGQLLFVIEGEVTIDEHTLNRRDELQIIDNQSSSLLGLKESKVLLFQVLL